jgi:type IX secretion system PorP/SprF family membrane protein
MKKLIFSLLLAAGFAQVANAQQDATYDMYMFNGLYINPAYAGSQDVLNIVGIFRNQWTGLDGAPRTVNVSADAPLRRDQYALGLTIANDRLGLTNMFSATGVFAYRIKIKRDNIISLGIQGGFTYYQQRNTEAALIDPNTLTSSNYDPAFSVNQNLWLPNVGAGVYAYGKKYYVGFSVPHLVPFSLNHSWQLATSSTVAHQYNQYLLTAGYVFGKDASIVKFRPTFLMKYQQGLRFDVPDFYFNAGLLFIDRIWVIAGVKTGGEANGVLANNIDAANQKKFGVEGIVGMVQAKITPQLAVGYAYNYALSHLATYETGTHEVMLSYQFWYNKKRFVTPRFVKYF